MPQRLMNPGSYRLLCWGQKTDTPRSVVLDADNNMIFDTSLVTDSQGRFADVAKLLSETRILVRRTDGSELEVDACQVHVQVAIRDR